MFLSCQKFWKFINLSSLGHSWSPEIVPPLLFLVQISPFHTQAPSLPENRSSVCRNEDNSLISVFQVSVVQFLQMLLKEGKLSEEQALAYVNAIKKDIDVVEEKEAKEQQLKDEEQRFNNSIKDLTIK